MLTTVISTVQLWRHTQRAYRETEALNLRMQEDIGLTYDKAARRKTWL